MKQSNRISQPGLGLSDGQKLIFICLGIAVWIIAGLHLTLTFGHKIQNTGITVPGMPDESIKALLKGTLDFPTTGGPTIVGIYLLTSILILAAALGVNKALNQGRTPVDKLGRFMATPHETRGLGRRSSIKKAIRLGVADAKEFPGIPVGHHHAGPALFASWEDMHVDIWGPRTGKTTSRAIPAIMAAPGAIIATTNKRDLVDVTKVYRQTLGRVWVFDPQQIAGNSEPSWFWNPLSYCVNETKAAELAGHFAAGSREAGAKTDAYFDPAGQDLLAGLLLAAALDNRPIDQVYKWLTNPVDDEPVDILRAHPKYQLIAAGVDGVIQAPDKQRGGIYGTALQMAACLRNPETLKWVTPGAGKTEFDAKTFIKGKNTLFSLSKEGKGTAGPLVTALTVAVIEAAETLATNSPGGRLPVPLLGVLDEAANVCRWAELPNLYSHYGSRGICLMTILQSWAQGVEVWGEGGMKKLWSAANIRVFGGNVAEAGFLEDLSKLIGDYEHITASESYNAGKRSTSRQVGTKRIMDVATLTALPFGRMIIFPSGIRPILARTTPWFKSPIAKLINNANNNTSNTGINSITSNAGNSSDERQVVNVLGS